MAITNSREFTINVGKIADAEKWLSEGADLWKEITGKDAVIYKEGWGDQYKMLFVTTYESNGMTNGDLISGAVDRFFTTIKDTRELL